MVKDDDNSIDVLSQETCDELVRCIERLNKCIADGRDLGERMARAYYRSLCVSIATSVMDALTAWVDSPRLLRNRRRRRLYRMLDGVELVMQAHKDLAERFGDMDIDDE